MGRVRSRDAPNITFWVEIQWRADDLLRNPSVAQRSGATVQKP